MKKILFALFLVIGVFAMAQAEQTVKYSNPTKPIIVSQARAEFTLTMKSNPTTGYSWFLVDYNGNLIQPVSHKFIAQKNNMPGAGGHEIWTFRVVDEAFNVPQITRIKLVYARPWLKLNTQPTSFQIVIDSSSKT